MKSVDLKAGRELFRTLKEKVSRLDYYAGLIRVTHTKQQLEQVVKAVHAVDKLANGPDKFLNDFIFCLRRSRVGSMDIQHINNKEVAISGVFSVEALRDAFIAVDNVPVTLQGNGE